MWHLKNPPHGDFQVVRPAAKLLTKVVRSRDAHGQTTHRKRNREQPTMATFTKRADLPPQLRALSARANDLDYTVRDALIATLSVAPSHATPEQVLTDTFGRLGYLPGEAKLATRKVLA
jgi:hypothetical protein